MVDIRGRRNSPMPRLPAPASIDQAPAASQALLQTAEARFGRVPNLALLLSVSPAALQGYLALLTALDGGALDARTAQRIALAVAEAIGCPYCLSLHTHRARNRIGLDDAEITANRNGASNDLKADVAVRFAAKLANAQGTIQGAIQGAIGDDDIAALKAAGYGDGQIIEIVLHAGLNTLATIITRVGQPDIDFPLIQPRKAD
jgi:AhpD family alkylhydroperoxidase